MDRRALCDQHRADCSTTDLFIIAGSYASCFNILKKQEIKCWLPASNSSEQSSKSRVRKDSEDLLFSTYITYFETMGTLRAITDMACKEICEELILGK